MLISFLGVFITVLIFETECLPLKFSASILTKNMATLEDKILGEKKEYYCSSGSEGEDSNDDLDTESDGACCNSESTSASYQGDAEWNGVSSNTGPKGVIKDWENYKKLEKEKMTEKNKQRMVEIQKFVLNCRSAREEEAEEMAQLDKELSELFDDEFLHEYRKKRMNEMLSSSTNLPKFSHLIHLKNGEEFLEAVDKENKSVTVIVHIYEDNNAGCRMMNKRLSDLSHLHPHVKFCKLVSSAAGMSSHFKSDGVPALLVYKGGQMVGNFVRVTDELGDDFYTDDVENYLIEHGMINDRSCVPTIIGNDNSGDSDVSLD